MQFVYPKEVLNIAKSCSCLFHPLYTVIISDPGAVGSGGNAFGLSDEEPILKNPMCTGSEFSLKECPGYKLGGASGYYCETGQFQAGVSCSRDNTLQCKD